MRSYSCLQTIIGTALILSNALSATAQDSKKPMEVDRHFTEAKRARLSGDHLKAAESYEKARKIAKDQGLPKIQGEVALHLGETLDSHLKSDAKPEVHAKLQRQAEEHYQEAIRLGTDPVKLLAQNNLGVLYLNQNDRVKDAVKLLESMKLDSNELKDSQRAIFTSNLGRAYEKAGRNQEAYQTFRKGLDFNPRYQPAAAGAFRILLEHPEAEKTREAVQLANGLLAKGNGDVAMQEIRASLRQWPNSDAPQLLGVFVRYYTATALTPDEFASDERKSLQAIVEKQPSLKQWVAEIDRVFLGDFPVSFQSSAVMALFPIWSQREDQRRDFVGLLKTTGEFYYRTPSPKQQNPKKALARFAASWALDSKNTESALFVAAVIRDFPGVDPDRVDYKAFVDSLVDEKTERYRNPPTSAAGWDNLLGLHYLLGTLFEKDGKWGSEYEVRSALYQWNRAVAAEKELLRLNPGVRPSPILHVHLAAAYQKTNNQKAAWDHYITAGEGFTQLKNASAAEKAVGQAKALTADLSDNEKDRLQKLDKSIADLPRSAKGQ